MAGTGAFYLANLVKNKLNANGKNQMGSLLSFY